MLTGLAKSLQGCAKEGCNERALVFDQGKQWCPVHALDLATKKARKDMWR